MKKTIVSVLVATAVLAGAIFSGPAQAETAPATVTQLLDMVAENKGKVVMLNFFAAWCPPCRKEIPGLISIRNQLSEDDFLVIGVALDQDLEAMEVFIEEAGFNYPVFHGGQEAGMAFRVDAIPYNVIYNKSGKMVVNESGYVPEKQLLRFLQAEIAN